MRDRLRSSGGNCRRPGLVFSTLLFFAPSTWCGDEATCTRTAAAFSTTLPFGTTLRSRSGLIPPTRNCPSPCESACHNMSRSSRGRDNDNNDEQRMPMPRKQNDSDTASADVPSLSSRRRKRRQHPSRQKKLDDSRRIKRRRQRSSRSGGVPSGGSSSSGGGDGSGSLFISEDFVDDDANGNGTWEIEDLDSALDSALEVDEAFESSIDSFLDGEYSQPFADEAPAPHPGLTPSDTVECALRSLRRLDDPFKDHGAAVFMRFCAPLSRGERWGGGSEVDPWKTVLRGAITPPMLARRLRASPFSGLLDWERLDITEGLAIPSTRLELGVGTTIAFVNAALYFGDGVEPSIIQFTLRKKIAGAWLIDTAVVSRKDWFVSAEDDNNDSEGTKEE